jgi:MFS family permease
MSAMPDVAGESPAEQGRANQAGAEMDAGKKRSVRALLAANFFLADVQTGLGPFLAAYLASVGWNAGRVGVVLTAGGVVTVLLQTPAGAIVDRTSSRRLVLVVGCLVLAAGAVLLSCSTATGSVYAAQLLIGGTGPFLAPTLAAITMGLVGVKYFDRQFGRNQSFNSAGNVVCALLIAGVSRLFGNRAIFIAAALLTIPTVLCVRAIRASDIDETLARGASEGTSGDAKVESIWRTLFGDRVLLLFFVCAFFFHFSNAAMLPQLGEMLSKGVRSSAAPFMSACIIVTQLVIMCTASFVGRFANARGRKPLLVVGFGVLPIRALLYTLTHAAPLLIAVQLLDGVANAIFGVVSILVVADRTRGTGRFNLVQGALATAVGMGAALSTSFGGTLIQHYSYHASFLALGAIALMALGVLVFGVPETLRREDPSQGIEAPRGAVAKEVPV